MKFHHCMFANVNTTLDIIQASHTDKENTMKSGHCNFAKLETVSNAIQALNTYKERTMKSRHFTYLWNTAAVLLLVLGFNVVSVFAQSVPGVIGNALSFDGSEDDFVSIQIAYGGQNTPITVEAWVRVDELVGQQRVFTKRGLSHKSGCASRIILASSPLLCGPRQHFD